MSPLLVAAAGSVAGLVAYHLWEGTRSPGVRAKIGDTVTALGKELGIGGQTFQGLDGVPRLADAVASLVVSDASDPTFLSARITGLRLVDGTTLTAGQNLPAGLFARVARDKVLSVGRR